MKKFIFLFLFIISCSKAESQENNTSEILPAEKVLEIKNFVKGRNYNQDIAVFINFKTYSGKYRYFVYDLKNNKILQKAVVSHGSGSVVKNSDALKFSNTEGSYQSSLGKYEILNSYIGKFGKAYRLNGLDDGNSNAMQRAIVLHSLGCVPDQESQNPACLSLGCPMLSQNALIQTAKYIDHSKQPVIMYAFY
ncbi:murein L,D-transpeptidase catalytic domain family protein [Chryseobacterium antibioticum]|uniref:Murein L,D-transpeptidase catalytic domain family protein n=1 Tax=Chryseobacterium pyrolae TaxID=2987481 RepID=A0ABT2IK86_9FLAO|nr:murein L,D-transpeptidase catalytic domain family protein [Chryseobacterium pyrolae]MCT2409056.1 murein L,D-transpeptidase catalytic domain family protein [Chryseobacterium pyrolae]